MHKMPSGTINILIVEDEQRLAEVLKKQLESSGFNADIATDGYIAKVILRKNKYNLVILDINIPLINGYDLCKEIRENNQNIPIIMLTAFGSPDNKVVGFDTGADDYIVKPYEYRELLARINVFLKRSQIINTQEVIRIANLEMNLQTKLVKRDDNIIDLTAKEYLLLETFLKNQDKLLTREYLIEKVWGLDFDPTTNIVDVYVNYLRKKIDKDFEPKLIHTKFGFGFYCSKKEL